MLRIETAIKTAKLSVFSNLLLAFIKGTAGIFGNSYALVADAIESMSDVVASILVFFGLKYAQKPADENHPYGHGRIEPLITFMVVGFLIFSGVIIVYQAILNIQTPHEMPKAWTLYVLGAIIIWKELSYQYVIRKSRETNSSSLKADAWHHRSDALTSIAAFVGIGLALLLGDGYETLDDWAAIVAACFIFYNSYKIFRPALGEIMDEHTHDNLVEEIRAVGETVPGVEYIEKCYVRKVGLIFHVDLHAWVDGEITVMKGHEIAHHLKDKLFEELPEIGEVLIHIEPANYQQRNVRRLRMEEN